MSDDDLKVAKNSGQRTVVKHIVAAFVAGFPLFCCGLLVMMNPNYGGLLIVPGSKVQPFGWLMTLALLTLAGLTYLGVITLSTLWKRQTGLDGSTTRTILIGLIIIGLMIAIFTMIVLIFLGPAILLFLEEGILSSGQVGF